MERQLFSLAKFWRLRTGLTQAQMARRAGITQAQFCDIERGQCDRPNALKKLAVALGQPADLLTKPVPDILDADAVRERALAGFAGQQDTIPGPRTAASVDHGVPPPPSLEDLIRKARS